MQSFSLKMILRSASVSVQNKKHFWKSADFGVFFFGKMQNNPILVFLPAVIPSKKCIKFAIIRLKKCRKSRIFP